MGLIQAAVGAVGGTLGDQWLDFYGLPDGLPPTAALFPAVPKGRNAGRGSNDSGSAGIITNGSKIIVPEGYGLVLLEDGAFTGFAAEPGAYIWQSDEPASQSVFSGGGLVDSIVKQSWERFKFGGRPSAQQTAVFVALKELPNNRFGTQSEIYWDDAFLNTQVGAITRGTYTLRIVDPLTFIRNFVPANVISGRAVFDFTDIDNPAGEQLFNEVVGSLAPAFSMYTNDPAKGQPDHAAPAGLDRLRPVAVRSRRGQLPVADRPRPGDRQDRDHLDRVRRQHPRAAQERPARRRALRLAGQQQSPGVGGRRARGGGRERRPRRHHRDGHGDRRPRRTAAAGAADPSGTAGSPGRAGGPGGSGCARGAGRGGPDDRAQARQGDARRRPHHAGRLRRGQGEGARALT
ncbi:SPFH domain-containing protein [Nocardioides sp. TF02-7]|uniref:SPFH domain-containing protein n=1 Tax=Nocardioides sp. TF02-7 TaxID=2917724 RepID=UPI001F05FC25|nr:SPFH domain-containing protein [Nocardioides sp. TF02-7]UMG93020.1 SPFH domain-containing protein [Nocardioides sp. TF02-7]